MNLQLNNYGSEIAEIVNCAGKAKVLLNILDDNYMVIDASTPTDSEKEAYYNGCGEIFALVRSVSECIDSISESIAPLMQEV